MLLTILFYLFLFVVGIQLFYYAFLFGKFSFTKLKETAPLNASISVIIAAKNEAGNTELIMANFDPKGSHAENVPIGLGNLLHSHLPARTVCNPGIPIYGLSGFGTENQSGFFSSG